MNKSKAEQELFEWEREAKYRRLELESEELFPACQDVLWATFLFDGFGFSDKEGLPSNIVKLSEAIYERKDKHQRRFYYPGLGASFEPEDVAVRSAAEQKAAAKAKGKFASGTKEVLAEQGKGIAQEAWEASQGSLASFPKELIKEGTSYVDFVATRDVKHLANAAWYELKGRWQAFQDAVIKHPWRVGKEAGVFVGKMTAGSVAESQGFLRDSKGLAMLFNTGAETRLKAAEKDFQEAVKESKTTTTLRKINIAIFGYDMGGGLALGFANKLVNEICDGGYYEGIPVSIKFMGLFDCVSQRFDPDTLFGYIPLASEVVPNTHLPPEVETCVHYAAAHEQRFYKPLSMLGANPQHSEGPRQERLFPGAQEDVGGGGSQTGYKDDISRYPLTMMYHRAYGAAIPMPPLNGLKEIDARLYKMIVASTAVKQFQLEYRKALHQMVEQVRTIPPLFLEDNIVRAAQGYEQHCEKPQAPITVTELPKTIAKEAGGHMAIYIKWLRMWFDEHKDDIQENTKWYSVKWDVNKADKKRYDLLLKDINNVEKNLPTTSSDYNQALALERLGGAMAPSLFNHDPQAQALWWLWNNPGENTALVAALYEGFKDYLHDSLIESDVDVSVKSFLGAKSYLNIREMAALSSKPKLGFGDYVKQGFGNLFL